MRRNVMDIHDKDTKKNERTKNNCNQFVNGKNKSYKYPKMKIQLQQAVI